MLVSEFIDRTGYQPSAAEYAEIERAYYVFAGDKDQFCRAWKKANPQKAGTYWAAVKEQEHLGKVFDRVERFVRTSKVSCVDFYYMDWTRKQEFMDDMCAKTKCKDRRELREMLRRLHNATYVRLKWKQSARDLFCQIELTA